MLAVTAPTYTDPSRYELSNVPKPKATEPTDVVIQVYAASINPVDVKKVDGIFKQAVKDSFPYKISYDAAGVVVQIGKDVKALKVGDEVYTRLLEVNRGSWSEFVKCAEKFIALKPKNITFSDAASLTLAGVTALQVLRQYKGSLDGKTVLIPGGLSGTGAFACQLAKNVFHAGKVITTVSTTKVTKVHELLGAGVVDEIIDYTKNSPIELIPPRSVDFLFDTTGQSMEFLPLLKPTTGIIVSISAIPSAETLQAHDVMLRPDNPRIPLLIRLYLNAGDSIQKLKAWYYGVDYKCWLLEPNGKDLTTLKCYVEDGKLVPVIGARIDLDDITQVRQACQVTYSGKGGLGKTVFDVIKE
ncbi:hypothetical protein MHUMG1_10566 [Metarhizium humberi]|uniref:Enoyl reductase (ER) domain-containing protein n=1 Tax=Metarhizium humberi TaxID=2596975 RepID=A0A9P8S320_9HYPO|nr:hypothetical protein MHUMG1_10566 [Metarhizium humberi]